MKHWWKDAWKDPEWFEPYKPYIYLVLPLLIGLMWLFQAHKYW